MEGCFGLLPPEKGKRISAKAETEVKDDFGLKKGVFNERVIPSFYVLCVLFWCCHLLPLDDGYRIR